VWEEIGRITVPYAYSRETVGVDLDWKVTARSNFGFTYELRGWDREFRETESTEEDAFRVSFDTRAVENLMLKVSYELGDRSIDGHYDVEAMEASFLHPEGANNLPGLRQFPQADRTYGEATLMAMYTIGDSGSITANLRDRDEDYDDSDFGLQNADVLAYGLELGWAIGKGSSFLFVNREEVDYFLQSRQSGATPSTDPRTDWSGDFEDVTDTYGLGFTCERCGKWEAKVTASWSDSDGFLDLFSPPGGTPDLAFDVTNYDDVELLQIDAGLGYRLSPRVTAGASWLWEDYDVDSFLTRGLIPFLPASPFLDLVNGGYEANVFGLHLKIEM
jgi:hypothetical protein